MLSLILEGFDLQLMDEMPVQFYCNCSKERVFRALISLGTKELDEMIKEGESIEVNCHFCNTNYKFDLEDLEHLKKVGKQ